MAPIRVGLIGLSSNATTSWASNAHLPYLTTSNGKYEIVALCNSSVEAAQKAVEAYKLPSSTKAYGDPQDLANDPEVRNSNPTQGFFVDLFGVGRFGSMFRQGRQSLQDHQAQH